LIAQGPPGRRWLLLETPLTGLDETYTLAADELRGRGFAVVVAHPERSIASMKSGSRVLEHELDAGSAMQLNAWSLMGCNGAPARANAMRLLHATPLAAVASDAHGAERLPSLQPAVDTLTGLAEPDPRRFVAAVPRKLLEQGLNARPPALVA
jgi:protein-tyrosine phosphatase